jgi:hypothetical protein
MKPRLPWVALWSSLVYLIVATALTGKLCFDQMLVFGQGAAQASGSLQAVSPVWVVQEANAALARLWWMCAAIGVGIVLIAASVVWVSAAGRRPSP